jgi:hypothetical protein
MVTIPHSPLTLALALVLVARCTSVGKRMTLLTKCYHTTCINTRSHTCFSSTSPLQVLAAHASA